MIEVLIQHHIHIKVNEFEYLTKTNITDFNIHPPTEMKLRYMKLLNYDWNFETSDANSPFFKKINQHLNS